MIILDTNVLSEMMRAQRNRTFVRWILATDSGEFVTTTVAQAEILFGVALLPEGRRRTLLAGAVKQMFAEDFAGRILPFDSASAEQYAALAAQRRGLGRPMAPFDAQIAAIARSRNAVLATRNIKDFMDCDVRLVNPWEAQV
ncbi:MAG: type II toxin-antitoxin system VapC family toxin [Roseiarcus sp.]|jgi:predicted nucleic acid-binding protein